MPSKTAVLVPPMKPRPAKKAEAPAPSPKRAYSKDGISEETREEARRVVYLKLFEIARSLPPSLSFLPEFGNLAAVGAPALADLLYQSRQARLDISKICTELEEQEKRIQNWFVDNLAVSSSTGVAGVVARVQVEPKTVPQVSDWPKLYAYIAKNKAFELLNRAVNAKAVAERWDAKKEVPGVDKFNTKKVSCVKVGGAR